jgi:hypothetical protein
MPPKAPPPSAASSPGRPSIEDIRAQIARAEAEGVPRDVLILNLTLRDEADLKRARSVGLHEISFKDGEMRFLGVKIVTGGVTVSALSRGA